MVDKLEPHLLSNEKHHLAPSVGTDRICIITFKLMQMDLILS